MYVIHQNFVNQLIQQRILQYHHRTSKEVKRTSPEVDHLQNQKGWENDLLPRVDLLSSSFSNLMEFQLGRVLL